MTGSDSKVFRVQPSLLDAYRADQPQSDDIRRAYLRFSWTRRKAAPQLSIVRWLLAGAAIGLGVASAATLIPSPRVRSTAAMSNPQASVSLVRPRAVRPAARNHAVDPPPLAAESLSSAAASASAALPVPRASDALLTPPQRAPASARSATTTPSMSDWQRAAAALRDGDLAAAEAALAELEQSTDLRDRQAAELARAQLLVGRGRGAEAMPTLQRLAREASSPVIRSQAASVLQNSFP